MLSLPVDVALQLAVRAGKLRRGKWHVDRERMRDYHVLLLCKTKPECTWYGPRGVPRLLFVNLFIPGSKRLYHLGSDYVLRYWSDHLRWDTLYCGARVPMFDHSCCMNCYTKCWRL